MSSIIDPIKNQIDKWCTVYFENLEEKAIPIVNDFQTLAMANSSHVYDLISYVKIPFEKIQIFSLIYFAVNCYFFCTYSTLGLIGTIFSGVVLYDTYVICTELDTLQSWVFTYKKEGKHLPLNDTIDKTKKLLENLWHCTHIKPVLKTIYGVNCEIKFNEMLQRFENLKASRFKQFFGSSGTVVAGFIFGKDWSFTKWVFGK